MLITLALFGTVSCNQGEFSGGGSKKTADAKKPTEKTEKPKKEDKLGKETEPEEEEDPEDVGGDEEDPIKPDVGSDTDQGLNDSLVDILGGLLGTNSGTLTQDNENEVTTAPGKAFRIGDGAASGTSCAEQVTPVGVAGKKYYFEFQVTRDSTQVDISFGITCGIDYGDTNFMILTKGGVEVIKQQMNKNTSGQGLPTQTLGIGNYTVVVESRTGTTDPIGNPTDYDDYLVGELKIKSNKPIKAGKIGSQ